VTVFGWEEALIVLVLEVERVRMRGGRSFEDGEDRRRRFNIFEDGEMVYLVFERRRN
jgi:hypothetical protein